MRIVINPSSIANATVALLVGQKQTDDLLTQMEQIESILEHLTTAFGLTIQTTDGARELLQSKFVHELS